MKKLVRDSTGIQGWRSGEAGCGPLVSSASDGLRPLRQQVFERVRASGRIARSRLARDLGISPATVTTTIADLMEAGLLHEVTGRQTGEARADSTRGRPPVALEIRPGARPVAGLKISDRVQTALIVDFAGRPLGDAVLELPLGASSVEALLEAMAQVLDKALGAAGLARADLSAVGVGLPGVVDQATGCVFWSPVLDLRRVDLATAARDRLGVPVTLDNDANLVALAELWFGAGRGREDFAVVTIEHGVGMGLVLQNRLYRGARGLGMELGHTKVQLDGALCRCGQRGCLEAYVADYALAREADTALNWLDKDGRPMPVRLESLFDHAKAGNAAARSIFRRAGRYLAVGLANVVNLFDPALIILSGERMHYDYLYAEETLAELDHLILASGRPAPEIVVQTWGDLLWAFGAAALALSHVTDTLFDPARDLAAQ